MGRIDKNGMPHPTYIRDKKAFAKHLARAYKSLLDELLLQLTFNPDNPQVIREAQIMRQVAYMLRDLDKTLYNQIERTIMKAFKDGQAYHLLSVKEAKNWEDAVKSASFNKISRAKMEALIADTFGDILLATQNTEEAIKGVVRETVKKVAHYNAIKNTNYTEQIEQLKKELSKKGLSETIVDKGFVGIIDARGRKWDLATYSKMVMTTKINQAFIEGTIHESKETGFDLAVISNHGAKDACGKWEGMVISMTGATKGYITYKQAKATNEIWHPNCEHNIHPIRSLDMLHPDDVSIHKSKMQSIGNVDARSYKRKKVK